ncbi:hypothetical protein OAA57_00230 [bacterium]|jgi:hypothetical protein|nr:hypothetical protein [bacterium]
MELNENTLSVLKNFSSINQNLLVRQGSTVRTMSEARNVMATAVVETEFPQDFGVYDLNEFIGVLSLVDGPRLSFEEEWVTIGDSTGRSKVKYFFSPEETLTTPTKNINMPNADVKFTLTADTLNKLRRAASTLGHAEVSISGNNGVLSLSVVDGQNSTSNAFSIDIDGEYNQDTKFNFVLNINNLKLLSGDYEVEISSKLISKFAHKEMNVSYWIALEKTSTFGV